MEESPCGWEGVGLTQIYFFCTFLACHFFLSHLRHLMARILCMKTMNARVSWGDGPLSPIVEFDVSFPDSDVSDEIFLSVSGGGEE